MSEMSETKKSAEPPTNPVTIALAIAAAARKDARGTAERGTQVSLGNGQVLSTDQPHTLEAARWPGGLTLAGRVTSPDGTSSYTIVAIDFKGHQTQTPFPKFEDNNQTAH